MLSTAFLTHPEAYDQVDRQECVRVDLGTGVTQKLSTDFIRVVHQTSRNQFAGNRTRVRIPPAAPSRSKRYIACSDLFYKSERAYSAAPPFQIESAALDFDLVLGADLQANATFSAITDKGCCEIAQQPPLYDTELACFDSYAGQSILLSRDHFRAEKTLAS